jgi:hypothetical protein
MHFVTEEYDKRSGISSKIICRKFFGSRLQILFIVTRDDDAGTFFEKTLGKSFTEPLASSCYNNHFILEIHATDYIRKLLLIV